MDSESNDKSFSYEGVYIVETPKRNGGGNGQGDRKSLLHSTTSQRPMALIRRFGIGKAKIRARSSRTGPLLAQLKR